MNYSVLFFVFCQSMVVLSAAQNPFLAEEKKAEQQNRLDFLRGLPQKDGYTLLEIERLMDRIKEKEHCVKAQSGLNASILTKKDVHVLGAWLNSYDFFGDR